MNVQDANDHIAAIGRCLDEGAFLPLDSDLSGLLDEPCGPSDAEREAAAVRYDPRGRVLADIPCAHCGALVPIALGPHDEVDADVYCPACRAAVPAPVPWWVAVRDASPIPTDAEREDLERWALEDDTDFNDPLYGLGEDAA